MTGWIGYALGYEAGRSDAESSRQQRDLVQRVMYGHRTIEVDQFYIDNLRQALHSASVTSDRNYDTADQFHREALEWKAEALHHKAGAAALQARVTALEAQLAERNTKLEQTQALYEWAHAKYKETFDQKLDLALCGLMATWLLEAHTKGKADRPEFTELRDIAMDIGARLKQGQRFPSETNEPEKRARIIELADALQRD
jgi:hypothetical protein